MKNLICSLVVLLSVVSFSYGQDVEYVVASKGKSALIESKTSGDYEFKFEMDRTKESVDKAASFYTKHFTVDFNEETEVVKIKMVENTASSRAIVSRFLSYNEMRYVRVDNEKLTMSDFIDLYLK